MISEAFIRTCAKHDRLVLSKHALHKMSKEGITYEQVREAIVSGGVMETQHFGKDTKVLFQQGGDRGPEFYVVVAACDPPDVVTVCRVWEDVWALSGQTLKRR
ncbi:MAG TPA: hypothetical protein DDZ84_05675 [Firmicutes bacterium]|nr:hypothetical protein [Bacillota bacterium]